MGSAADRVLCLVPARSGSTRIADKNLQEVGGQTLLARAVAIGREAFGRVLVSTDSERYAALARAAGADVPSLRPRELAASDTPVDAVVAHAVEQWAWPAAEVLVLVQPTSPFSCAGDLAATVDLLDRSPGAACAITACAVPATTAYLLADDGGLSRFVAPSLLARQTQDLPMLAVPTGAAYAARIERLRAGGRLVEEPVAVVLVDADRALDIDDPADLERARRLAG